MDDLCGDILAAYTQLVLAAANVVPLDRAASPESGTGVDATDGDPLT
ncbi:hypothetical protein AB0H37_38110 [Actinomadura sp. NPDC023710]